MLTNKLVFIACLILGLCPTILCQNSPLAVMEWQKCLGGDGSDLPNSIIQTFDGEYPLSINAVFTLNNAVKDTKVYCKTTTSSDICTETPVITSDTIVLNCIGVPTTDLTSIVQLFDVYPNPNKGVFTIKLNTIKAEKIQLNILNYLGQTIKSALINSDNYLEEFNLSNMPNGIYLIKLTINGQITINH